MPPRSEPASVEGFLDTLRRSNLLDPDALRAVLRNVPADALKDAAALAEHFVRLGKLSHFQAGKLLEGTFLGLVLGLLRLPEFLKQGQLLFGKLFALAAALGFQQFAQQTSVFIFLGAFVLELRGQFAYDLTQCAGVVRQ